MDLLSVSTSYSALEKKYNNFSAPSVEITVGGKKLVSNFEMSIYDLYLDLTSGNEASGCTFTIAGEYEVKNSDFSSNMKSINVGEKVEVSIGYVKRELVFVGYINNVRYIFAKDDCLGFVEVECMDIKGLLMKNRRLQIFTQSSADAVVKELIKSTPISSYIKGNDIDVAPKEQVTMRSNMATDYEIIVEQANKLGYEFFVSQGKLIFRKAEKVSSPIMSLSPEEGIWDIKLNLCAQNLVKEIEIRSVDQETGKLISGKATISGKFSNSSSGSKVYGSSKQIFYEAGVNTAAEAKSRAKARMDAATSTFGELECECIGIPEIGPGRFIKIERLASNVNGKYYITSVNHSFNQDGFTTKFVARRSSL